MSVELEAPKGTSTTNFTCTSCHIQFPTSNDQRIHMKGDWHRYNLKRRVAQLPPIQESLFNSKVNTFKEEEERKQDDHQLTAKELRRKQKEELLEKKRKLLELAKNRIGSNAGLVSLNEEGKLVMKKDNKEEELVREEVMEGIEKENEEEVTQEDMIKEKLDNKIDISNKWCIICMPSSAIKLMKQGEEVEFDAKYQFNSVDETIEHLFNNHNLYIPESSYLVNKEGLVDYIYEKLSFGNVCLSCNYQGRNLESVKHHMLGKGHIRIPFENEEEKLELGGFYDFSSTWETQTVNAGGADNDDNDEWEDVSDEELANEEVESEQILATDSGLHLPNGLVVGHRSLMRYYKQNLPEPKEVSEGQGTVMAAETRRGLSSMLVDKEEVKENKRVWRKENRAKDRYDRHAAKFINWQEHYRDELLQ